MRQSQRIRQARENKADKSRALCVAAWCISCCAGHSRPHAVGYIPCRWSDRCHALRTPAHANVDRIARLAQTSASTVPISLAAQRHQHHQARCSPALAPRHRVHSDSPNPSPTMQQGRFPPCNPPPPTHGARPGRAWRARRNANGRRLTPYCTTCTSSTPTNSIEPLLITMNRILREEYLQERSHAPHSRKVRHRAVGRGASGGSSLERGSYIQFFMFI